MDTDDRDVAAPAAAAPETVTDEVAATPPPAVPAKDEEPAVPAKDDVETDKPQEPAVTAKDHVETDTPQEQEPPVPAKDEPAAQASTGTATPGSGSGSSSAAVAKGPLPRTPFTPLVTVVGFHHARGPEVESWFGADEGADPAAKYGWGLLPFMALSDGAHASEEEFSYFTLLKPESAEGPATSLFGLSCTRQIDSTQLLNRPDDVTRSTVQKAVVVIADSPKSFGLMRQRLGIVTKAWFDQRDFTDVDILRRFQDSLAGDRSRSGVLEDEADRDQYIGMSLRELIHEFKWQTLVLLKCCLLQPKVRWQSTLCFPCVYVLADLA